MSVKEEGLPLVCEEEHGRGEEEEEGEEGEQAISANYLPTPKSNARRNPWGNFSYADLITQVIHDISAFDAEKINLGYFGGEFQ